MARGILSPRGSATGLGDQGERGAFIARQRVRREPRTPRAVARRWARRLALAGLGLAALGAAGGVVHWALTSPRFAVTRVEVRGASRVPVERLLAVSGIAPGANLWRIDPAAVLARVEGLPEVRRAELVRELPNRVILLVEERRPFTLVSGGHLHWLDEDGHLLGPERRAVTPPVPVISGLTEDELAALRTQPSPKVRQGIALIRILLRTGSPLAAEISEIDLGRREGPVLYTVDGIEVRLGAEHWEERLARLEGVLAQVAGQPGSVKAIDLRFRDQVVLTKGGSG